MRTEARTIPDTEAAKRSGIQALRAIACMLVILYHVTYYACITKDVDFRNFVIVDTGRIGVFIFFVISGFVMGRCFGEGKRFLLNRILRIYPPYWIALGVSFALLRSFEPQWHIDLASWLLLPSLEHNNSVHIPYWTLCYEIAFYCITYVMILVRLTRGQAACACLVWIAAIGVFEAYREPLHLGHASVVALTLSPGPWILLSPMSIFFAMGLFVSLADTKIFDRVPATYLALFSVVMVAIGSMATSPFAVAGLIPLAVGYSGFLLAIQRVRFPTLVSRLGDFSYGTYLVHISIVWALVHLFDPHSKEVRLSVIWIAMMAASTCGGLLFGWFEYALHNRFVKQLFRRRSKPARNSVAT
ncbi:exopolysaccharide production protein ExoZ [Paraburkholderia sp. GAS199]